MLGLGAAPGAAEGGDGGAESGQDGHTGDDVEQTRAETAVAGRCSAVDISFGPRR